MGLFFIPLRGVGFSLVYHALKPAGKTWATAILVFALYLTAIGVALHSSLAFVGDIVVSGDTALLDGIRDYWQPGAYSVAVGYAVLSVWIFVLILTGRSRFPRWTAAVSPLGLLIVSAVLIAVLPDSAASAKAFLSLSGLNFPLLIFFPVTAWALVKT